MFEAVVVSVIAVKGVVVKIVYVVNSFDGDNTPVFLLLPFSLSLIVVALITVPAIVCGAADDDDDNNDDNNNVAVMYHIVSLFLTGDCCCYIKTPNPLSRKI